MSLKLVLRNAKNEDIVGRFELRGASASADGVSDAKDAAPFVLNFMGETLETPSHVAPSTITDVFNGAGRPVVLLVHGYLGHKNYVYQKSLAKALKYPSFRFDFRDNGESTYPPDRTGDLKRHLPGDLEDLDLAIDVLTLRGWRIFAIIAHSRGCYTAIQAVRRRPLISRFLVCVSGPPSILQVVSETFDGMDEALEKKGWYEKIEILKNGKSRVTRLTESPKRLWKELDDKTVIDLKSLPRTLPTLMVHGTKDNVIPINEIASLSSILANSTLRLVAGADHTFRNGFTDHAVTVITDWLHEQTSSMGPFYRAHCITPPVIGAGRSRIGKERAGVKWVPSSLVEGVQNFRDFGGYPVRGGKIVRWEHLYRCAKLDRVTEKGKRQLQALGVTHMVDLRSNQEICRDPTPAIGMVERVHAPVSVDKDYSPAALAKRRRLYTAGEEGFAEVYMTVCKSGTTANAIFLRHLLSTKKPTVVHCTAGKDRTGVFVALLLKFLEVDDDLIVRDYALTDSLLSWSDAELSGLCEHSNGIVTMEGARMMLSARPRSMELFLEKFTAVYGSVERYYEAEGGLSKEELMELKRLLVVGAQETCPPLPPNLIAML
ncbi:tyrosine phosphatase family-domain-containing protein [Cladochytrium replicatum]|nr:tyrosine phosphatase family-domain-containing protein [Cladochytrium replicatum]